MRSMKRKTTTSNWTMLLNSTETDNLAAATLQTSSISTSLKKNLKNSQHLTSISPLGARHGFQWTAFQGWWPPSVTVLRARVLHFFKKNCQNLLRTEAGTTSRSSGRQDIWIPEIFFTLSSSPRNQQQPGMIKSFISPRYRLRHLCGHHGFTSSGVWCHVAITMSVSKGTFLLQDPLSLLINYPRDITTPEAL